MSFRLNKLAPATMADLGDGRKCQFRADQNAIYELEELTGLPVGAWLTGYGEDSIEIAPERTINGKQIPARYATRRGRLLDLAWALSASWRQAEDPEMTPGEFRSILPTGDAWQALSGRLETIFQESFLGPQPAAPVQLSEDLTGPAPGSTGAADTSRDASFSG